MSSDARIRFLADGSLRGSHDGECLTGEHPKVVNKYELSNLMLSLERCMGERPLAWEIQDSSDGEPWLAGYCAR